MDHRAIVPVRSELEILSSTAVKMQSIFPEVGK